jgi:hypothetical protein
MKRSGEVGKEQAGSGTGRSRRSIAVTEPERKLGS